MNPKQPIISLSPPDKSGNRLVRVRVSFNGRCDLYPKVSVKDEQWDENLHRVKHGCRVNGVLYSTLNKRINDCLDFIQKYCDNAQLREDETACAADLKQQYGAKFKRTDAQKSDEFFFMLEEYIERKNKDNNWSEKYYSQWKKMMNDLKDFKPKLKFSDLSDAFLNSYVSHLSERMSDDKIKEYLKKLKEFIRFAKKKNMPIHQEFFEFKPKLRKRDKKVMYLHPNEVQDIIALSYPNTPSIERVRDIFIFQCCTSLRYSDVKNLTHDCIRLNEYGKEEVLLVTQKDKGLIWFELNEIALGIYNKYKDNVYDNNRVFHVISDTDFRKFLHRIGKDAGIKGEVTTVTYKKGKDEVKTVRKRADLGTHDARRTFIVTTINNGASADEIALYTSHAEVKQMMPYLTISTEGKKRVNNIIVDAFKRKEKEVTTEEKE